MNYTANSTDLKNFRKKKFFWRTLFVCCLLLPLLFLNKCGSFGCKGPEVPIDDGVVTLDSVAADSVVTSDSVAVEAPAPANVPASASVSAPESHESTVQNEAESPAPESHESTVQNEAESPAPESHESTVQSEAESLAPESHESTVQSEAESPKQTESTDTIVAPAEVVAPAGIIASAEEPAPVSFTRADSVSGASAQKSKKAPVASADTAITREPLQTDTTSIDTTSTDTTSVLPVAPIPATAASAAAAAATTASAPETTASAPETTASASDTTASATYVPDTTVAVQPVAKDTAMHDQSMASDTAVSVLPVASDTAVVETDTAVSVLPMETDTAVRVPFAPKKDVVALRTNLLYDAVLVPNIGIEVWLGKQFTLGADWFGTWLSSDKKHIYWQGYGGYLTLRYYFGKQAAERRFTGHHVGIYGSALTYDVEFGGKGYQAAKFGFGGGIEYGYSLPVHKCLTIDFNIGVGYQGGEYKTYQPTVDGTGHYVWLATYNRNWWGPTKAEISLKWLIAPVDKKKGGEQ